MVAIANIQTTFYIPTDLVSYQREALAELIIQEIIARCEKGIDVNGRPFKRYSESYKNSFEFKIAGKNNKPNLILSGEMLYNIELISHQEGEITIGFDPSDTELAGKVEGNQIGSYGRDPNPDKARKFLGLPPTILKRLIFKVRSKFDLVDFAAVRQETESIFDKIFFETESQIDED